MAAGLKTGGRKAGTPNKATVARAGAAEAASGLPLTRARANKAALPGGQISANPGLPPYRLLPIDSLAPYENNARTHSPAQVDMLVKLITRYGWTNPVLIDGKRGIIAGHGRVLAARKMGMDAVPTIELSHMTKAERRAYVIADNKSALDAGWDDDLLRLELGELRDEGFDLDLTGFDEDEIDALFEDDADGEGAGAGSLAAQFGIPPFTVLNAREGWWQDRKRAWLSLGIQSELGRGENLADMDGAIERREAIKRSGRKPDAIPGGAGQGSVMRNMGKYQTHA